MAEVMQELRSSAKKGGIVEEAQNNSGEYQRPDSLRPGHPAVPQSYPGSRKDDKPRAERQKKQPDPQCVISGERPRFGMEETQHP